MKCYRDTYKVGLPLLLLNKEREQELIDILECDYDTAMTLSEEELMERRVMLQILLEKYGNVLKTKKEYYALYYMIGNMESNYRFAIKEEREKGEAR